MLCYAVKGVRNKSECNMNINAASDKQVIWKAKNLYGFSRVDRIDIHSTNLFLATTPRGKEMAGA